MGLASIVYDVLDDYIVHSSFQRYLASERAAALEHLKNLEALNIYQDSIVIFDRGYYSENFFRYCVEHGHLCLMRLKEGYNLAKKCSGDVHTFLPGNSKDGTTDIDVRVIEVTLDDGTRKEIDLSAFITQYEFLDSDTIAFTVDSAGKVKAIVKESSTVWL